MCCTPRNLQMLSRVFQQLVSQLYGELFRCLNIFKRHCKTWLTRQNSAASQQPLKLASVISASGMVRPTTWTCILFALVCLIFNAFKWYWPFGVALDPNYKVAYAKDKWAYCFSETGMQSLERVVSHSSSLTVNCILTLHSLIDIITVLVGSCRAVCHWATFTCSPRLIRP